jgi:hypothetical protein
LSKQKVTSTLLYVGAPKPEGYLPPQSQTAPATTTVGKDAVPNEARKEPASSSNSHYDDCLSRGTEED